MLHIQNDSPPQADFCLLAKKIYSLGPTALAYLFADLAADKPIVPTLEGYAALEPLSSFIAEHIAKTPRRNEVLQ